MIYNIKIEMLTTWSFTKIKRDNGQYMRMHDKIESLTQMVGTIIIVIATVGHKVHLDRYRHGIMESSSYY